jgi:hypothetical protein
LLYAYCREDDPLALAVFADGEGIIRSGSVRDLRPFSLPPLPEGFVYTGIGVIKNTLAASWEEQQEAGIGAAGFLVVSIAPLR